MLEHDYLDIEANLGPDTEFEGSLSFSVPVFRIQGKFKGEIRTAGLLFVDRGALVEGNIYVGSIVVGGVVRGDIEAKQKVELLDTAKFYGNIRTYKLKVADRSLFEGSCDMLS